MHLRDHSVHLSGYYANPSSCVFFGLHVCWLHASAWWPSVCYTRGRQRPSIDGQASWTAWKIIEAHIFWCWDEKWLQLFQGKTWMPSVRVPGSCGLKINNMHARSIFVTRDLKKNLIDHFPSLKGSVCSHSCFTEAPWFNWNIYTVCRMWAILLGCILREQYCNNRVGKEEAGDGGRKEQERGRVRELHFHRRVQSHNAIL